MIPMESWKVTLVVVGLSCLLMGAQAQLTFSSGWNKRAPAEPACSPAHVTKLAGVLKVPFLLPAFAVLSSTTTVA